MSENQGYFLVWRQLRGDDSTEKLVGGVAASGFGAACAKAAKLFRYRDCDIIRVARAEDDYREKIAQNLFRKRLRDQRRFNQVVPFWDN